MSSVWSKLERIPQEEPGPAVSTRFYAMMEAYRHGMDNAPAKISWSEKLNEWLTEHLPRRPVYHPDPLARDRVRKQPEDGRGPLS